MRGDVGELRLLLGENIFQLSASDAAIAQRALAAMEAVGAQESRMLASRYGVDFANKIGHVFANSGHKLGPVVERIGSAERAFVQLQRQVEGLTSLPRAGKFKDVVSLGGQSVTVEGHVVDGVVKIATAFIP